MQYFIRFLKHRREFFRNTQLFYRSSKVHESNDLQLMNSDVNSANVNGKEVKCFSLLNKPLFPGLSYVLNVDKNLVNILENCKEKKIYVGLFFNKKKENGQTYDLLCDEKIKLEEVPPLEGKEGITDDEPFLKKDLDFIKDVHNVYSCGSLGIVQQVLYNDGYGRDDSAESGNYSNENLSHARTGTTTSAKESAETEGATVTAKKGTMNNAMDSKEQKQFHEKDRIQERNNHLGGKIQNIHRIIIDVVEKVKIVKWVKANTAIINVMEKRKWNINNKRIKIYQMEIIDKIKEIIKINSTCASEYNLLLKYYNVKNVHSLVNLIGSITISKNSLLQDLFEKTNVEDQLKTCLNLLNEDIFLLKMKKELSTNMQHKFTKEKEELIIKEYITNLKKKIGQKSEHENLYEQFFKKFQLKSNYMSQEASTTILREINKFSLYSENCVDYSSSYQYLNTVLSIPYGKYATLCEDIKKCEMTLCQSHYGLYDVKRYILEYLGLYMLNKNVNPKILLLVGYPGIGKTSICKSISLALHLPYCIINMNNIHNMNELIGHRRTYVNSYEGKIVQALISTDVMNPLIILDEFDKISFGNTSIYNTLLNIFDNTQNKEFKDLYINFPINLENVFFVCTANSVDEIPEVLLDRMEIINIYPYTNMEKILIFKNYLKEKIQTETKITNMHLELSDELLLYVIQNYTNENGIRQFYSILYNIYKKRAYMLLKGLTQKIELGLHNLHIFQNFLSIGNVRTNRGVNCVAPCLEEGTLKSLAFSDNGGQVIIIEVSGLSDKNSSYNIQRRNQDDAYYNGDSFRTCEVNIPKNRNDKMEFPFPSYNLHMNNFTLTEDKIYHPPNISKIEKLVRESEDTHLLHGKISSSTDMPQNFPTQGEPFFAIKDKIGEAHRWKKNMDEKNLNFGGNLNCQIIITGNVGKIMQESILIANTFSIQLLKKIIPNFQTEYLHINMSECDMKKDGPSAGINFVTSILSYYLKVKINNSLCMTGEITLNGYVLRIGGLTEKIILARNFGIRTLIIPKDNAQEYEMLPTRVKENIHVLYVQHYYQIFNFLFPHFGTVFFS
ncbi:ATP-dependent protease [Plasmodium gonderi]|uniref:ATP-dependent protease n=1 Tax=Plasmodium gonderi TaxID=77519 RepID=A0A1Y1JP94_PLAGO|nr:ATP-dependent protease [Plasmodium gonderi]GAW83067.1 ATP-dependent protease [Plasmodium gonderi]